MADPIDPRLTPARAALGVAPGSVGLPRVASRPTVPLTDAPDAAASLTSELVLGERFDVHHHADGWAWGQCAHDGYVGFAPASALAPPGAAPTHRVAALSAPVFPAADLKTRPVAMLPYGALVAAGPAAARFHPLAEGGFIAEQHLVAADAAAADWVAEAQAMLGAPYLWGGRTAWGLDCSGLVQAARRAAGRACPRDADMQEAAAGEEVAPGAEARGDLIFWRGHVGIMVDGARMLHANAHAMSVTVEPLAAAEARIAGAEGPVTARRRWR